MIAAASVCVYTPEHFSSPWAPRLRAVRALVLRDMDSAVSTYQQLVSRRPDDAGGWLDLGRAQVGSEDVCEYTEKDPQLVFVLLDK